MTYVFADKFDDKDLSRLQMTYGLYLLETNERDKSLDFIVKLRVNLEIKKMHHIYTILEFFQHFNINHVFILEEHLTKLASEVENLKDIKIDKLDIRISGLNSEKPKLFPKNLQFMSQNLRFIKINQASKARWNQIDVAEFQKLEEIYYNFSSKKYARRGRFSLPAYSLVKNFSPKLKSIYLNFRKNQKFEDK